MSRVSTSVRAGCLLSDLALARELARRVERQLHGLRLEVLESPDQLALTEEPRHETHDLIVVDAGHADASVERLLSLSTAARPELILVGLPALRALRLRMRGLPLALEVTDAAGCDAIVDAIRRVVAVHLPTRWLSQELVGRVDLPAALAILRYHMMTSALARTGTKRATAKLLGVSRPAVQQMLRALAPA